MKKIATYNEIKFDVLSIYWLGCRDRGFKGESHQHIVAWALDEWDGAYDHPFENLIFHVIALALGGPWSANLEKFHRKQCELLILSFQSDLPYELLSKEEAGELQSDIKVLGLI
ncbi:hypothetical protein GCM10009552_14820 [Rothia nasimurium]|uniref:Uncharacterized protein n=1 Tax=Luteibacter anthropi TaxID=564369 RepID=A0A7X5UBP2_9GAMM|nr:hypothetical protein [Luteibacter anthropi]NII07546.1 hypothetical protein [Luteibacter anthropi]